MRDADGFYNVEGGVESFLSEFFKLYSEILVWFFQFYLLSEILKWRYRSVLLVENFWSWVFSIDGGEWYQRLQRWK